MKNEKLKIKNCSGYTIIETMIAISLFLVVIVSGMGALLSANLLHQKSRDMRSIMDNLSFIMEDMGKNIRTGYNYHCFSSGETIPAGTSSIVSTPKSCAEGWAIAFEYSGGNTDNHDDQWIYYLGTNGSDSTVRVFKATQGPYAQSNFVQLTPDEVAIDPASSFIVIGAEPPPGNSQQPFVTIRLVGKITYKNVITPFSLQTSMSQRAIDI